MFVEWAAFMLTSLMVFVPLSIPHFISFLILGRILKRGSALTALAAAGIALGLGSAAIVAITLIVAIEPNVVNGPLMLVLACIYPAVFIVPLRVLYGIRILPAIGIAAIIGLASVGSVLLVRLGALFITLLFL